MVMVCCLSVLVEKVCSRSRRAGQGVKEQFEILKDRTHQEAKQVHEVSQLFFVPTKTANISKA